jgi:hypothetical protein
MDQYIRSKIEQAQKFARLEIAKAELEAIYDKEHILHFKPKSEVERMKTLQEFYRIVQIKTSKDSCGANVPHGSQLSDDIKKVEQYREVGMHIVDTFLNPDVWVTGVDCAWVSGEYNGCYYNAVWKDNTIRYTMHNLSSCNC